MSKVGRLYNYHASDCSGLNELSCQNRGNGFWNCFGIWGIGFPTGLYLSYVKDMKAVGLWYGLATGLSVTAVVFMVLFIRSVRDMKRDSLIV